ncbi:MAG: class I SAM-dependent methyltransferase [Proteobacteria bacterium]|nr:class I SAM-dependent methyltransferase [Pseudomonadota bacterium]
MKKQPIYKKMAAYYDLIYSWKNYKKEVSKIKQLIKKYKKSSGYDLLETACGTGKHAQYLKDSFSITAIDMSQEMLTIARKNVKGVTFKKADMMTFNLPKKFDVILCLFSSIGYVKTYAHLKKTLQNFSNHLKKGGIVIIEPWLNKSTYIPGMPDMQTYSDTHIKIARLSAAKVKGNVSIIDLHYLIAEKNKDIQYYVERHEMGMFEIDRTLKLMEAAGLKAKFIKNGLMKDRGLYIGIKQ